MAMGLAELADRIGARLAGDSAVVVRGVATLEDAGSTDVSFLSNRAYRRYLRVTRAAAVILAPRDQADCPTAALVMDRPYVGYARAVAALFPVVGHPGGISPDATVAADARVEEAAWVGPRAVVEEGAWIGPGSFVGPGCVIGAGARVGRGSRLVANVTLGARVVLGERVLIHPGAVLGGDGFGFAEDNGRWLKIGQLGSVVVGDDVEIGANTTIDRGALKDTVIGDGVKLDNQIQIGHNVEVGEHTIIAGCSAIAGSTRIGRRCALGGGAMVLGHLELADDVHITALTTVFHSIRKPGVYSSGLPEQDNRSWRRNASRFQQLDEMMRRIRALERQLPGHHEGPQGRVSEKGHER